MPTNEQIEQLHAASRDGYEFARACYMAGSRDRMKLYQQRAATFFASPCVGKKIAELIMEDGDE